MVCDGAGGGVRMNKRTAHIKALRWVAELAETTIGSGFSAGEETEEDDDKVYEAMRKVCEELNRRADTLETRQK